MIVFPMGMLVGICLAVMGSVKGGAELEKLSSVEKRKFLEMINKIVKADVLEKGDCDKILEILGKAVDRAISEKEGE